MGWDGVPWMVGGGAEHSANVARNVSFGAYDGQEGIVTPLACEVRQSTVAGANVQVFPGTVAILNRALGIQDEMYVGRLPTIDTVGIPNTNASGPRSDLIIARVENPFLDGEQWSDPVDPKVGPYIFTRVISNVPATTTTVAELGLGYSAIALARVDQPANNASVTQAMIKDLRVLNRERTKSFWLIANPTTTETLTGTTFTNWPEALNTTVDVPAWATHVRARAILGSVTVGGLSGGTNGGAGWDVLGHLRIAFGTSLDGAGNVVYTPESAINEHIDISTDRTMLMCGGNAVKLPTFYLGKKMPVKVQGNKTGGTGSILIKTDTSLSLELEFYAVPVSSA